MYENTPPEEILKFPIIPPHLVKRIPEDMRPGPPTNTQKLAIRRILNMRQDQSFNRCRGKAKFKLMRLPAFHADKDHDACELCRCSKKGGQGTRGDFYGLGPETGCLGVGYCMNCMRSHRLKGAAVVKNARRDVEMMQKYGSMDNDSEFALKVQREETALAKERNEARDELTLIIGEIKKLATILDGDKKPQMYVNGGKDVGMVLQDVDDKTLLSMKLNAAKILSGIRVDDLKLKADDTIHVDYLLPAMEATLQHFRQMLSKAIELTTAKTTGEEIETERPVLDYVWDMVIARWVEQWNEMASKAGMRKGGRG